jgi:uncharacterized protein YbjT (DUF2867 family)
MKILVTTPGGRIGRIVLGELLAPEFSVRVIAREPSRLPEEVLEQVEFVRGSTDDAKILRSALEGVESVFWCVPPPSLAETHLRSHYERFSSAACQAVRAARTPRVVSISCGREGSTLNAGMVPMLDAIEDILKQSGAAIRHLRCGAFMENESSLWKVQPNSERGLASYPVPPNGQIPRLAARDIADVALRWLVRRDWEGIATVPVRRPQNLAFYQVQGAPRDSADYEEA